MSEITIDNKLSVGMGSSVEEIADAVAKVVPAATEIASEVVAAIPAPATPSAIAAAVAASLPATATPAQVASAVVSALPHTPTAAEVAAAVAASMPTQATVLQGQVAEFVAGSVPADYAQVSGGETVLPADTGFFGYINLQNKIGYAAALATVLMLVTLAISLLIRRFQGKSEDTSA